MCDFGTCREFWSLVFSPYKDSDLNQKKIAFHLHNNSEITKSDVSEVDTENDAQPPEPEGGNRQNPHHSHCT